MPCSTLWSGRSEPNGLAGDADHIPRNEAATSAGLGFTIDGDFPGLEPAARVSARVGQVGELQQLSETDLAVADLHDAHTGKLALPGPHGASSAMTSAAVIGWENMGKS